MEYMIFNEYDPALKEINYTYPCKELNDLIQQYLNRELSVYGYIKSIDHIHEYLHGVSYINIKFY